MEYKNRASVTAGLILILIGSWFFAIQLIPGLRVWINPALSWPLIVIGVGAALLIIGLLTGAAGMAIPACIVGGIGGLLYWQNATGHWESWAYAWTLIPGFVGLGIVLTGLMRGQAGRRLLRGGWLIVISALLFLIFASFLGGPNLLGPYWPVLLILAGLLSLGRNLLRSRK